MPVPKKARALERGVVSTKATAPAAVSAVKKVSVKKTTIAKKAAENVASKTTVVKKLPTKALVKAAPKKAVAKKAEAKKKVTAKSLSKTEALAEEMISIDASSGAGVVLKDLKKLTKGTAAYNKAAMKMAGQVVKGKPSLRADKAREKALEALLRRNGIDGKPEEVSVETSYRVGEGEQGVTLFSRIKTDRTVILTARVFGFGFVVLGACLTLLTVNRVPAPDSPLPLLSALDNQMASLLQGTSSYQDPLAPVSSSLSTPEPPTVDFLSLPSSDITGVVEISLMVPASTVMVDVYNRDTKQWKKLGSANTSDQQVWRLDWNTANFLPGAYDVVAIVTNAQGTFHVKSDRSVEVADQTTTTSNTAADSDSSATTSIAASPLSPTFNLRTPLSSPFTSRTPIYLNALNVTSVKATLLQESTNKVAGTFTLSNLTTSEWRFFVDPANYSEGEYTLKFIAQTNTGTVVSSPPYTLTFSSDTNVVATTAVASAGDVMAGEEEEEIESGVEPEVTTPTTTVSKGLPIARIRSDSTTGVGYVVLFAETEKAIGAEFYARPAGSFKDVYIGQGTKVDEGTWRLVWDTKQTPNGTYEVFSRHRSVLGVYGSTLITVSVKNPTETLLTTEQKAVINEIANTESLAPNPIRTFIDAVDLASSLPKSTSTATSTPDAEGDDGVVSTVSEEKRPRELLPYFTYRSEIEQVMTAYGNALRTSDAAIIDEARVAVLELKKEMINSINPSDFELRERLAKMVEDDVRALTQEVEQVEEIIRARVGEAAAKDSDRDTITDYDEVNLYTTNPFSADSDGDGFTDAVEITGGYDPLNVAPESLIAFESPKEAGVVRDDIFVVTGIASAEEVSVDTTNDQTLKIPTAVLTGRALPNSFVTIYIFSTPIIATVKTNDDGSWSYRFDKELEDGEHEVFVGITDNAGTIIAKSNPFIFVKEAQAFTPVDADASLDSGDNSQLQSFFSLQALIIALGGVVIALGLILLMISMYLIRSQETKPPLDAAQVG